MKDDFQAQMLAQRPGTPYSRAIRAFPSEGIVVHEGEKREYLIVPQTMFNVLDNYFEGLCHCDADGCNSPATASDIRWLQSAAGLPVNGCWDTATWDMLSHLYEIFVVQDTECQPQFTGGWG